MYLEGSSAINGVAVDDPEGKQPNYTWTIDSIPPDDTATITYRCQIDLNAVAGYHENEAVIESYFVDGISVPLEELPRVIARVKVTLMETKGIIIGKVFEDLNEDGWQVLGEISKFVNVPESGMAKLNFTITRIES